MKRLRWIPAIALTVILIVAAWMWWHRPQTSDMANYAPADSLVYVECNSVLDVADAIARTDGWKTLSPLMGTSLSRPPNRWWTRVISWTGIGPARTVILARAQWAAVMLDLGAREEGDTLTVKPEAAILIETHTGEGRIRQTVEEALRLFAEKSYRQPTLRKVQDGGNEFLFWSEPTSERQIVATIDGTLVIIGNSELSVKTCLEVRRGLRPSLKGHPEMQQMRGHLAASPALAFGFISSSNAARLFSLGAPLLLGMAPGDARFDRVIGTSAPRVLAAIGWSSRASARGMEDRYLFSLRSTLVSRVQQQFRASNKPIQVLDMLPGEVHSVSVYRFENPLATWQLLETALSAQLDTLSAMLVSSLLKSSLTPYGIEDPETFLKLIGPELSTVRLTRETQPATLIAEVRDETALRQLLIGPAGGNPKHHSVGETEVTEIPGKTVAVSFHNDRVLIGPVADLQLHLETADRNQDRSGLKRRLEHFLDRSNSANVVTYERENDRIMDFVQSISRASGDTMTTGNLNELSRKIEELPYSATETSLNSQGLERVTRSSFGQFATLVPLLFPEP